MSKRPHFLFATPTGYLERYIQLLEDNASGVRGALEGGGLPDGAKSTLTVRLVGPARRASVVLELAGCVESTGLALACVVNGWMESDKVVPI